MDILTPENSGPKLSQEPLAMTALDAGRMLMEAGARAKSVERIVDIFARGLGAERVDLRVGYASLEITVGAGESGITRMRKVGPVGVNQQLEQRLWDLAERVARRGLTIEQVSAELARIEMETPRHSAWVVALAVGLACAAFGRLLGVDWAGIGPVFVASTVGQYVRGVLHSRRVDNFICTTLVSFASCVLAGVGARAARSETETTAMVAAILLLVPGVPALNAQSDILEGRPTLGSARVVTVVMTLIFIAAGLWVGRALLSAWQ